jgi:hypothetical protein
MEIDGDDQLQYEQRGPRRTTGSYKSHLLGGNQECRQRRHLPEDVIKYVPNLYIKKTWRSSPRRRTNQFTYLIRLSTDDKDPPTDVARSKTQVL